MSINQNTSQKLFLLIMTFLWCLNFTYSQETRDTNRLSISEFTYAKNPRYRLISGTPPIETKYSFSRVGLVGGGVAAAFLTQHYLQLNTIWEERGEFKVLEDGPYALYVDKTGHFVSSYLSCYALSEALLAADFSYDDSMLFGGILGLAYISYIEIMDGYGVNFGFSPTDFYFNAAGSLFYIGQYYFPYLQNITPKFSYIPGDWHGEMPRQEAFFFVDDYASQTFWLSFDVYNMIPGFDTFWPKWLNLSVGYAARNLCDPNNNTPGYICDPRMSDYYDWGLGAPWGSPRLIFALDYDLTDIIPKSKYNFVNWLVQSMNYLKWPSPAVEYEFDGTTRFYLLYPF